MQQMDCSEVQRFLLFRRRVSQPFFAASLREVFRLVLVPPFWPPFLDEEWSSDLPRPDPLFFPP